MFMTMEEIPSAENLWRMLCDGHAVAEKESGRGAGDKMAELLIRSYGRALLTEASKIVERENLLSPLANEIRQLAIELK